MTVSKGGKITQYMNYRMRVATGDSRILIGTFLAFDKHMNLVLGDCEEFRRIAAKGKKAGAGAPLHAIQPFARAGDHTCMSRRCSWIVACLMRGPFCGSTQRNEHASCFTCVACTGLGIVRLTLTASRLHPTAGSRCTQSCYRALARLHDLITRPQTGCLCECGNEWMRIMIASASLPTPDTRIAHSSAAFSQPRRNRVRRSARSAS